jgi:ABC-type glycerol-3-phosphate transport system substrate-binding protein
MRILILKRDPSPWGQKHHKTFGKSKNVSEKRSRSHAKSGAALCELLNVSGAEGLIRLRARRESGERILGYPTKNGAKYLLFGQNPIAVRNTATDEEKKIAYTFLSILLSRESAIASIKGNTYASYSVRKDILDEQFNLYENKAAESGELGNNDPMPTLDREKDQAFFNELIQNAVIQRGFPFGLQQVFDEEFGDYVSGRIGDSALTDHLKNRVRLYLSE